jgi:hypothetical protein
MKGPLEPGNSRRAMSAVITEHVFAVIGSGT